MLMPKISVNIFQTPSLKKTAAYENGISVSRTIPRPDSIRSGLSERRSTKADIEQLVSSLPFVSFWLIFNVHGEINIS